MSAKSMDVAIIYIHISYIYKIVLYIYYIITYNIHTGMILWNDIEW